MGLHSLARTTTHALQDFQIERSVPKFVEHGDFADKCQCPLTDQISWNKTPAPPHLRTQKDVPQANRRRDQGMGVSGFCVLWSWQVHKGETAAVPVHQKGVSMD